MADGRMSPISFFPLHLELRRNGRKIGDGTGFLYEGSRSADVFVVTNYHVLTGRSASEPERILPGFPDSPDQISFALLHRREERLEPDYCHLSFLKEDMPTFVEHRDRSRGVDIAAVKVVLPADSVMVRQTQLDLVDDIALGVGSDLFIVGFPYGFGAGDFFPIWKRATIATEPSFKPGGFSRFYVDSSAKPGMSGSPVFATEVRQMIRTDRQGAEAMRDFESGKLTALDAIAQMRATEMRPTNVRFNQLVGIYSGRVAPASAKEDAIVGTVWRKELIDEMLAEHLIVEHPFPPERVP